MKSIRVIPVSAVLSRVPYVYDFLHMARIPRLHTYIHIYTAVRAAVAAARAARAGTESKSQVHRMGGVPRLSSRVLDWKKCPHTLQALLVGNFSALGTPIIGNFI